MTIGDAYTRWATTYDTDRNRTRDLDRMTTEVLLGDNYYDKVLELGCGTGKNTGFLVRVSRALLAIDFSVGMLEQAKVKVRSNTVLFIVADLAKSWPCQRNAFELIVCNLMLEHIEDLDAVFSQAFQALREGGLFLKSREAIVPCSQ
jgi:ubiquinone/menaquinone biosynthesis C-methylase UbiE